MTIHLTCSEIHDILNKYVQKIYNVSVKESCSHTHADNSENVKEYGPVGFSFDCVLKPIPPAAQFTPVNNLTERNLEPEI